jgi:hypothetical protein
MSLKNLSDEISVYTLAMAKEYGFVEGFLCVFRGLFVFNAWDLRDLAFSKRSDFGSFLKMPYCL